MVKIIGMLLIASSIFALFAGIFIDSKYGNSAQVTGSVISNIINQPKIDINLIDYLEAAAFSYSIISFVMGFVFLFRFQL